MKKISCLIASLFLLISSTFALGFNLEVSGSFPAETTDYKASFGVGGYVGADIMFSKKLGLGIDFGIYGPFVGAGITSGGLFLQNLNSNDFYLYGCRHDNNVLNFDIFTGVVINAYDESKFALIITPGFNADIQAVDIVTNDGTHIKNANTTLSIGVDFKANFKLNHFLGIHVGAYNGFSIVQLSPIKTKSILAPGVKNSLRTGVTFKIK